MMPFRLPGAMATSQQLMDQILQPHEQYTTAYIIMYSTSWEDHLQHLYNVLHAQREARLTVNPAKCHLGQNEVTFLDYTVGGGELQLPFDKVQVLQK